MSTYWCEQAWLPDGVAEAVRIDIVGECIDAVTTGAPTGSTVLRGVTVPGFAITHSHAFHRALRGRTDGRESFWSWRDAMYLLADRLDPDRYYRLARAVYGEMVLAGFTSVASSITCITHPVGTPTRTRTRCHTHSSPLRPRQGSG